jgi:alpha-beta hydrolase superfamily lysophospholipase
MTASYVTQGIFEGERTRELVFAGDNVRLAGQIDYPHSPTPAAGFPLLFILHHAGCDGRDWYAPFAQAGLDAGFAVFRWDKRGTGRSGAGGTGSTTQDAVNAYEIALEQPYLDRKRVVILAQAAGTGLLGNAYGLFARVQPPRGVILASNMLDEESVLAIETRIMILVGRHDWNPSQTYAEAASKAHNRAYKHGASYHIIPDADRKLLQDTDPPALHPQALSLITDWLKQL